MLAWSEGTLITDVRKPEIMVMTSYDRLFTDYSSHPRKLVAFDPETQINERRTLSFFPVGGMPTASSLA